MNPKYLLFFFSLFFIFSNLNAQTPKEQRVEYEKLLLQKKYSERSSQSSQTVKTRTGTSYGTPPNLAWVESFGGTSKNNASGIVEAPSGEIYITGSFSGKFEWGSNSLNSVGNADMFLAKTSANGNLLWLKQFSGAAGDFISGYDVALTSDGNVVVAGQLSGTTSDFGTTIETMGFVPFLFEFDQAGTPIDAIEIPVEDRLDGPVSIEIDDAGNRWVLMDLIGKSYSISTGLLKLDEQGNLLSRFYNETSIYDFDLVNGAVFIAGSFDDLVDFGGTDYLPQGGFENGFVTKLNTDLEVDWVYPFNPDPNGFGRNRIFGVEVDADGSFYVAGEFEEEMAFGATNIYSYNGGFIAKIDTDQTVEWFQTIEQTGDYFRLTIDNPWRLVKSGNQLTMTGFVDALITNQSQQKLSTAEGKGIVLVTELSGSQTQFKRFSQDITELRTTAGGNVIAAGSKFLEVNTAMFENNNFSTTWENETSGNSGYTYPDDNGQIIQLANGDLKINGNLEGTMKYGNVAVNSPEESRVILTINPSSGALESSSVLSSKGGSVIVGNSMAAAGNDYFVSGVFEGIFETAIGGFDDSNGSAFVAKYNKDDEILWLKQFNAAEISSTLTDVSGNVYLSGFFVGMMELDGFSADGGLYGEGFIIKISGSGQAEMLKSFGGGDNGGERDVYLAINNRDEYFVAFSTNAEMITVDGTDFSAEDGTGDLFLMKLDAGGGLVWFKQYGASPSEPRNDDDCTPLELKIDSDDNLYMKGEFNVTNSIGNFSFALPFSSSQSGYNSFNYFIAKFDDTGEPVYVLPIWGVSSLYTDLGKQIDVDNSGNLFFEGSISDSTHFGNVLTLTSDLGRFGNIGYYAKLDDTGTIDWLVSDSNDRRQFPTAVKIVGNSDLAILGEYSGTIDFSNGTSITRRTTGGYVGLYSDVTNTDFIPPVSWIDVQVSPNPTANQLNVEFDLTLGQEVNFELFNLSGQKVKEENQEKFIAGENLKSIDLSNFHSGVYFLKISTNQGMIIKKFEKF